MRDSKRRVVGFTLVEMLLALAVIALLTAIGLGVFTRVREQGRNATCQGNLHQMSLAMQQYVSDYNGTYPPRYSTAGSNEPYPRDRMWFELLQPYLKSTQVFRCPSNIEEWSHQVFPYRVDYLFNFYFLSIYSANPQPHSDAGKSEAVLPDAMPFYIFSDAQEKSFDIQTSCGRGGYWDVHSGGVNYSFADGHVKWFSAQQQGEMECVMGQQRHNIEGK